VTSGVTVVPEVPVGRHRSSSSRVLFTAMFPMFVFSSFSASFGRSLPCSSPTDCATGTLSHICSHRKAYCTLDTHFDNRKHTGVLQLVLCFCIHGMGWPSFIVQITNQNPPVQNCFQCVIVSSLHSYLLLSFVFIVIVVIFIA